jgi:hypothetical protein
MKISKTTPLEELIPYFAELALSRGLDEQPSTDRQELVARIKELEALPEKNAEGDADGDGSESGTEGDADGDGSESGTEGDADGDGSESGTDGAADGDGSESGTEGDADGDGSESGTEGDADGEGSESGTEGGATGDGSAAGTEGATDSDVKLVSIKPLCSIRCSHGQQRYNIDGNSKSVAVPESLANDLVNGKYAVLI